YHLWSESYDRELKDIFQVQDEIARAIVDALKVQFGSESSEPLVAHTTDDLEAYTLYLKARFHYNKVTEGDLHRSIELYREALRDDPEYARAWAGIADCWMLLADDWMAPNEAYPKAKEAALKALAIEPGLAEANTALGKVLGWYDWDFDAGELALRRAVASNPKYADAHWGLATLLPTNGRLDESVAEMRTALALDPLSAIMSRWLARYLLYSGRHDEALEMCENALSLNPSHAHAYLVMGQTHLDLGDPERAIESFREGARVGEIGFFETFLASAMAAAGREAEAREILDRLRSAEDDYVRPEAIAMLHGWLGEMDPAFQRLEAAVAARSAGLIYLHIDPSYKPLRSDPRFDDVVRRLGLRAEAPSIGTPRPV
ncbi:MAG: tetratricopeptide repeat protein, partial [Longimicrobiales bacterium]|nr:tetratricopeptide repeat protein [Longimicrobiales bacterium]